MQKKIRPKAIAKGKLFDRYDCYVLEGGVRVLSKRGVVALLSGESSGDKDGQIEKRIRALPSRYRHLAAGTNVAFALPGGQVGHAVDADTIIDLCFAYIEAGRRGELRKSQLHYADNALDFICRAASTTGIVALIDEATGYDAVRKRGDLLRIFRENLGPWEHTFSGQLVHRLCQLGCAGEKHVDWHAGPYPRPLAKTFRRIYDLVLGEAAAQHLKAINPEPKSGSNHHQWLTDEAHELLKRNMALITFAAQQSHSRKEFFARLRAHYVTGQSALVYSS